MRSIFALTVLLGGAVLGPQAVAQQPQPQPTPAPGSPAMTTPATPPTDARETDRPAIVSMTALENGANSFTEGQARTRFEAAGFSAVDGLAKDDNGIWRGRGMRDGAQVSLAMDFRGRIAFGPAGGTPSAAPAATPR